MSKYNKGDKFEIEIKEVLLNCTDGETRYLIKGFSSLTFDDYGLDRLKQTEPEELEVDWSKVPVDTPILVRDHEVQLWEKAHFADYKDGKVGAWYGGRTSWNESIISTWNYAKLAEVEE